MASGQVSLSSHLGTLVSIKSVSGRIKPRISRTWGVKLNYLSTKLKKSPDRHSTHSPSSVSQSVGWSAVGNRSGSRASSGRGREVRRAASCVTHTKSQRAASGAAEEEGIYSAVQMNVVRGCVKHDRAHATFDHVQLDAGELRAQERMTRKRAQKKRTHNSARWTITPPTRAVGPFPQDCYSWSRNLSGKS